MNEPAFRKRHLLDRGLEPIVDTPEQFARFQENERRLIRDLVEEAGIKPQ
jgi:tyrosine-protein phosphatase YwqE